MYRGELLTVEVKDDGDIVATYKGTVVKYLSLSNVPIPDDVTRLHVVGMSDMKTDITDIIPIEDIYIEELSLVRVDVAPLDGIVYNNLHRLEIRECTNTVEDRIVHLNGCPRLGVLSIYRSPIIKLPDITDCTELTILHVTTSDLSTDALTRMDLSKLTKMDTLIVQNCRVQGVLPDYIAGWSKLSRLILPDNYLFGNIPDSYNQLKSLKELNLSDNGLEGDLAPITGMTSLQKLNIMDTDFEDNVNITAIVSLPDIQEILMYDEINISNISGDLPDREPDTGVVTIIANDDVHLKGNEKIWTYEYLRDHDLVRITNALPL